MTSKISLKETLKINNHQLQKQFVAGGEISDILKSRSDLIDQLLQTLWDEKQIDTSSNATLVAVGGYGRAEMHPASDVDVLILLSDTQSADIEEAISEFITHLWDFGLEIGHSVRTVSECIQESQNDLTIITNLIESRFLCGDFGLFKILHDQLTPSKVWSSEAFFTAKLEEQENRYKRFGDTAYRVEPNLKEGPGGLRDLQMIGWIVLREYGIGSLQALSQSDDNDLLNAKEYESLIEARDFLWKVRFVLHQLTGRKEDRLLFDHQRHLAHSFGFTNDENNESIEAFMQRYYKTITELERLNEILLGLLRSQILEKSNVHITHYDDCYSNVDNYLEIRQKDIFKSAPPTFLALFNQLQLHPELKGLTPKTIRELRRNLHLIDDSFREDSYNKSLFIKIISHPSRVNFVLRRMNRYGVLAAYIPLFANIVGRMQYDLFHAFTVDDHTLNVVRNIRRLSTEKGALDNPTCSELFNSMEKPMLLVLAGIFHDIAKGRKGNHSELGAIDALDFCLSHGLDQQDAQDVSWLVEHHLLLSGVAQRKDINDPDVIEAFTDIVSSQTRLDMLYILTICDIKGTNPTLLTTWKHSLLKQLYKQATHYLNNHSTENKLGISQVEEKKRAVLSRLAEEGKNNTNCLQFWSRFDDDYFQQYSKERLYWHICEIANNQTEISIVRLAQSQNTHDTVLLVYTQDQQSLFVKITSAIEQHRLDIVGASITSTKDNYDLLTFYLSDKEGKMLESTEDKQHLLDRISTNLQEERLSYNFSHHRLPRQLKHFDTKTMVSFALDDKRQQTVITIRTADAAGLLTRMGEVFSQLGLLIHAARITTLGEIAEDIFQVTTVSGKMIIDEDKFREIEAALLRKLDL